MSNKACHEEQEKPPVDTSVIKPAFPENTSKNGSLVSSSKNLEQKQEARQAIKSVIILAVAACLLFTASGGLSSLQSSLFRVHGMGVITQACQHAAMIFSSFYFPNLCIEKFGHRKTMTVCFIGYMTWMVANGYAVWATMVPTSIIMGLCAGPLFTTQSSYIRITAYRYAKATGSLGSVDSLVIKFFSFTGFISTFQYVFGALINFLVLRPTQFDNVTLIVNTDFSQCGANDCPWSNQNNTNLAKPPKAMVWTLVGVYLAISVIAVILLFFIDDLDEASIRGLAPVKESPGAIFKRCSRQLIDPYQLLWTPMMAFIGYKLVLVKATWTNAFVACTLGIYMIGAVELPGAILTPALSLVPGLVVKYVGRVFLLLSANGLMIALMLFALFWVPDPSQVWVYYLISVLYHVGDTLIQAPDKGVQVAFAPGRADMAFAASFFIKNIFSTIGFSISNFLCTNVKAIIGISMGIVGVGFYIVLEVLLRKGWRSEDSWADGKKNDSIYKDGNVGIVGIKWEKKDLNDVRGVPNAGFQPDTTF